MASLKKKKKPKAKAVVEPKSAKDLAGAMFFLADEKLPPDKRRFAKNARLQHKSVELNDPAQTDQDDN